MGRDVTVKFNVSWDHLGVSVYLGTQHSKIKIKCKKGKGGSKEETVQLSLC